MNITDFMIPAWLISFMAILSAIGIFLIKPMPLLIRISLMVPFTYFGILYIFINSVNMEQDLKTTLVRFGLFSILFSILSNSAMVVFAKRKGIEFHE